MMLTCKATQCHLAPRFMRVEGDTQTQRHTEIGFFFVAEISHLKLIVRHEWDLFEFRCSQRKAENAENSPAKRALVNANVSLW